MSENEYETLWRDESASISIDDYVSQFLISNRFRYALQWDSHAWAAAKPSDAHQQAAPVEERFEVADPMAYGEARQETDSMLSTVANEEPTSLAQHDDLWIALGRRCLAVGVSTHEVAGLLRRTFTNFK